MISSKKAKVCLEKAKPYRKKQNQTKQARVDNMLRPREKDTTKVYSTHPG
jgi:hypothetical protein